MGSIYSIGHGSKEIEQLLSELDSYGIQYVLDVRTSPYSKWNPQFNKEAIQSVLTASGIRYVFFGDSLGGRPSDSSCYDEKGKVLYKKIEEKQFFKDGIARLIKAHEGDYNIALMCSESNPAECHRSKLIGQHLLNFSISLQHIIDIALVKPQETVANELTRGKNVENLFGEFEAFKSRKSY